MLRNIRREPSDQEPQHVEEVSIADSLCLNSDEILDDVNNNSGISLIESSPDDYFFSNNGRASTAPIKAMTGEEEYKWNYQFSNLEKCVFVSNRLVVRQDNKFDVDSEEGLEICKKYMEHLEKLIKVKFRLIN
jgi:hypothetical protein